MQTARAIAPLDPAQSKAELEALGIPAALPREAADYGRRIWARCTRHDVQAMRGFLAWGLPMRFLRDTLVPLGWTVDRPGNLETVVSPDASIVLATAAGDQYTGDPDNMPSTRTEKGPRTEHAIQRNQLTIPNFPKQEAAPAAVAQTWFLLSFYDKQRREIRIELSRGVGFTATPDRPHHGVVSKFEPRLYVEPIKLDAETAIEVDLDSVEEPIEIDVTRRIT